MFTDTYSACPIAHANSKVCQAACNANTLTDSANIQVIHVCASCDKHSAASGQESQTHQDNLDNGAKEGTFSAEANDCLKRYSYEHRQAVVWRNCTKPTPKGNGMLLLVEEAEAKELEEAEA